MVEYYDDLITHIETISQTKQSVIIAIDGASASGKTTLANDIQNKFDATIIHMDDFFLPKQLRTPARFNEPGGNIHYEYFKDAVVAQLHQKVIAYRPFDCHEMNFKPIHKIPRKPIVIIEGSYATHPYFGRYYDVSIFLDIDAKTQVARLVQRNGEHGAKQFINRWIGLENTYFDAFAIEHKADYVFKVT